MSDDWIKVRTVLPTDGRLKIVSRTCHASTVTAFGALVTLWCLADSHAAPNGELVGYTKEDIDALVCLPGFCDALPADWIDITGEFVKLPDYQEHNGTSGKTRAQAAKRQRKHRDVTVSSRSERDTSVTREEKRREERKDIPAKPVKPSKTTLPDGFGISERVRAWAEEKGHGQLEARLENFKGAALAKAYAYADWDAAFMNAIRDNWAKLGPSPTNTLPAGGRTRLA